MAFDTETRRAVRRAYVEEGLSMDTIGAAFGLTPRTVLRWKADALDAGDDRMEARRTALRAVPPMTPAFGADFYATECAVNAAIKAAGADRSLKPDEAYGRVAELLSGFCRLYEAQAAMVRLLSKS